jgi:hypothetical protein
MSGISNGKTGNNSLTATRSGTLGWFFGFHFHFCYRRFSEPGSRDLFVEPWHAISLDDLMTRFHVHECRLGLALSASWIC